MDDVDVAVDMIAVLFPPALCVVDIVEFPTLLLPPPLVVPDGDAEPPEDDPPEPEDEPPPEDEVGAALLSVMTTGTLTVV